MDNQVFIPVECINFNKTDVLSEQSPNIQLGKIMQSSKLSNFTKHTKLAGQKVLHAFTRFLKQITGQNVSKTNLKWFPKLLKLK